MALPHLCGKATNGATKVALPVTVLSNYYLFLRGFHCFILRTLSSIIKRPTLLISAF
ncbi:hypothetical protein SPONN_1233 [uncultured Candidatus Thioglobus sp.]|nr:hypothetical protein SPONN_1233 [uncultured Candidatus Thioglobus sp.]